MEIDSLSSQRPAGRRGATAALVALWLAAAALLSLLALQVHMPLHFQDEFFYWALARSIATGHGLTWRDGPVPLFSALYPILIAPVTRIGGGVASQYDVVKVVNAACISAVVFPVYAGARWFVSHGLALAAALLAVAAPAAAYAGLLGTEVLAYPLGTAALLALVYVLARPGRGSTVAFLGFAALAAFTRIQFVAFFAVAAAALVLVVLLGGQERRRERLAERRVLGWSLAAVFVLACVYVLVRGRASVGIYLGVLQTGGFEPGDVLYWLRAYAADAFLLAGILPAVATFALVFDRSNRRDPLTAALIAVAIAATVVFVLQMTAFASINTENWRERHVLYERYMIYLGPVYFVGLVASLGRVSTRAALISTAIAALVLAVFPSQAISVPFSLEAFSQSYLGFFFDAHPGALTSAGLLLALIAVLLGGVYALTTLSASRESLTDVGRLLAIVLPLFVMLLSQAKAWSYQEIFTATAEQNAPKPIDWVDRASGEPVAMLAGSGAQPLDFLQPEFWNPNVARLYTSAQPPVNSPEVFSHFCPFRTDNDGRVLGSSKVGCARVLRAWLTIGASFSMTLRDARTVLPPNGDARLRLQIAPDSPRVLAMVGGRDRKSGLVNDQLEVRTFCAARCVIRVIYGSPRGALARAVGSGNRLTRLPASESGSPGKVASVELREGKGPWRPID